MRRTHTTRGACTSSPQPNLMEEHACILSQVKVLLEKTFLLKLVVYKKSMQMLVFVSIMP